MKNIFFALSLTCALSINALAQEDDFDVVEEQQVAPKKAAPTAVVIPDTDDAPRAQRVPQAVANSVGHHCGSTTEYNISSDLGRFCKTDSPFSFSPNKDGLFFCCVKK
ncbi:MAG: hypothetical protein SGI74_03460 [Oligoflexia bacterium]|nr:hypothetical protein [Oligoflexia bacterium]